MLVTKAIFLACFYLNCAAVSEPILLLLLQAQVRRLFWLMAFLLNYYPASIVNRVRTLFWIAATNFVFPGEIL